METKIDKSYFWGDIALPALFKSSNEAEITKYIRKYESEYLEKMFGEKYTDCPEALYAYLYDENKYTSPIANYIYVMYQNANTTFTTQTGEKKLGQSNTTQADDRPKRQAAWNRMVDMNQRVHQKLYALGIIPNGETPINYLNDILFNLNVPYESAVLANRTQNIRLFGGIFSNRYKEDFPT